MLRHIIDRRTTVFLVLAALAAAIPVAAWNVVTRRSNVKLVIEAPVAHAAESPIDARRRADFAAMQEFRPGYPFWQHVFTLPDGSIAFGSAVDGRLLATFPTKGVWTRQAVWGDPKITRILDGQRLALKLRERRQEVAVLLEGATGPVLHNSTRGDALLMTAPRYGAFLAEWGAIYERFGVPADIGLAQVIFESGLNPTRRSEANAVGFCQWLVGNWKRLNYFSPTPIEGRNQTTQAPDCAAYLSVLATNIRIVHPRALRAQRGRHECRSGADQWRVPGCRRRPDALLSGLQAGARSPRVAGQGLCGGLQELWPSLVSLRRDGVRQLLQHPQARGVDVPDVDQRDAYAASGFAGRDRRANASLRRRGAPVQSGTGRTRSSARHALPSRLRQRVWS